jgi:hypothetical protein
MSLHFYHGNDDDLYLLLAMGPFSFFFFLSFPFSQKERSRAFDIHGNRTWQRSSEATTYDASPPSHLLSSGGTKCITV